MAVFDGNDPKYLSCCCNIHVTTLARFFVVVAIAQATVDAVAASATGARLPFLVVPIVGLGAYGVYWQLRSPIIAYTLLNFTYTVAAMANYIVVASYQSRHADPKIRELAFLLAESYCLFVLSVHIAAITAYVNLAHFINDREIAFRQTLFQIV